MTTPDPTHQPTHHLECWRNPRHHACAVVHVGRLQAALAEWVALMEPCTMPSPRDPMAEPAVERVMEGIPDGEAVMHEVQRQWAAKVGHDLVHVVGPARCSLDELLEHTRAILPQDPTP